MSKKPKILYWDIETSLMKVYSFSLFPKYIPIENIETDWKIICICYAINDGKVITLEGSERAMIKRFLKILNDADIIVYHNGDKFDLKKFKARVLKYDLDPVKLFNSFNTVDTLKVARKEFAMTSNKLDYIAGQHLGIGNKIHTDISLWIKCSEGCKKALKRMSTYCAQDVVVLRKLYYKLRKYDSTHPNMNLYNKTDGHCPNCGKDTLNKNGFGENRAGIYRRFICSSCKHRCKGGGTVFKSDIR